MNGAKILQSVGIEPNDSVFSLSYDDALVRLLDFIEEWELDIKVAKISRKDWQTIFSSYADSIINYHPDNDHQERAVFLKNEKMLEKYGLTDEDVQRLDFS